MPADWLALVQHELLLFAGAFFLLGALDELALDVAWLWLRATGRARTAVVPEGLAGAPLHGPAAVFIPAWREAAVIGPTVHHALAAWPQADVRIYVGSYRNDPATAAAVRAAGAGDPRVRLVVHDAEGPTTKGDCLNALYRALALDEQAGGWRARMVVLHDAEDMVDPLALPLLDREIANADMVQLPVVPAALPQSRWIASHYCEEFSESHTKAMVVRDAIGAGLPTAGVGCAIARDALDRLHRQRGGAGPFGADCLTEDYELGLGIAALGGRTRFIRRRAADGRLVATRACFPTRLECAVRQKARWVHGIAFQGWDRLGWSWRPADLWMRLRDRRGPLAALVLAIGYLSVLLAGLNLGAQLAGFGSSMPLSRWLHWLLLANLAAFAWRAAWRFGFTVREYGWAEGLRALARIPLTNVIAIMAGRRALTAYVATLAGRPARWDKTRHTVHPALAVAPR